ncbi:MAG: PD40 domain-containing protein [Firmicutes bacterium]|nr:PD40 domain-containing protein [Bacillota bacterium]
MFSSRGQKPIALLGLILLASALLLTGCGGGVRGPHTGTVQLTLVDASNPTGSGSRFTGKITLGGRTAEVSGTTQLTFSNLDYGSYPVQAAVQGYIARPLEVILDAPEVSAELVLVPTDDTTAPLLLETNLLHASGETEPFLGQEVYRLSGLELVFSEYVEPIPGTETVISISSGSETIDLGPRDFQLSRAKLTFSPSRSWNSGAQAFPYNWEPGQSYTLTINGLQDYAGNPFTGQQQITFTGSPDATPPPAPTGLSGQSTEAGEEVLLQWGPVSSSDLWGYLVFRKRQDETVYQLVNQVPLLETSLLDTELTNGIIYEYQVKAVDLNGNVSTGSEVVSATPASPNRGIIAFASDRQSLADRVPDFNLYVKFYDAGAFQEEVAIEGLVPFGSDSNEDCPAWSPDGRRLAYTSTWNAENPELYVADLVIDHNGRDTIYSAVVRDYRQLTMNGDTEASPAWSPDGRSLVYVSYSGSADTATESQLKLIDLSTGAQEVLVDNGRRNEEPAFRPQGDKIVYCTEGDGFESFWEIHLLDLKTGATNRVEPQVSSEFLLGDDRDPAFSPDGTKIAFSSSRGHAGSYYRYANIWVMDLDGGNAFQVTSGNYADSAPVWSPDGKEIIFTRECDDAPAAIYRVAAQEGAVPQLVVESSGSEVPYLPAARNWLPTCAK